MSIIFGAALPGLIVIGSDGLSTFAEGGEAGYNDKTYELGFGVLAARCGYAASEAMWYRLSEALEELDGNVVEFLPRASAISRIFYDDGCRRLPWGLPDFGLFLLFASSQGTRVGIHLVWHLAGETFYQSHWPEEGEVKVGTLPHTYLAMVNAELELSLRDNQLVPMEWAGRVIEKAQEAAPDRIGFPGHVRWGTGKQFHYFPVMNGMSILRPEEQPSQ